MLRLNRLVLTDFRNYATLMWHPMGHPQGHPAEPSAGRLPAIAVLAGPNGSGKTNLLEAVSLLVPGRGLRGARVPELPREGSNGVWGVAGRFATILGETDIGTGTAPGGPVDRRVFRLDGAPPRNQAEIGARVAAVWLTPRMDRLFQEGASGRRRFLDRLVWALEAGHAREVAAHDAAMAQRNRLLAEGRAEPAWLSGLEEAMARHGVAATAARMALIGRLNEAQYRGETPGGVPAGFPAARLGLICPIADRLAEAPALRVEDWLRATLAANRGRDALAGGAIVGAHRADMRLMHLESATEATQASTGQQKALLIAVVLSHAHLIAEARGFAPILLLDEPTVHLDLERRLALFRALRDSPAQTIVTGTDLETFRPLAGHAAFWRVEDGTLEGEEAMSGSG